MQRFVCRRTAIVVVETPVAANVRTHFEAVKRDSVLFECLNCRQTGRTGTNNAYFWGMENPVARKRGGAANPVTGLLAAQIDDFTLGYGAQYLRRDGKNGVGCAGSRPYFVKLHQIGIDKDNHLFCMAEGRHTTDGESGSRRGLGRRRRV